MLKILRTLLRCSHLRNKIKYYILKTICQVILKAKKSMQKKVKHFNFLVSNLKNMNTFKALERRIPSMIDSMP